MRIIAYDIANLTDARYFAARGAHAIGFSTELSSIDEINAMKDWLDVPDFFIRIPAAISAEELWELQERTGISTFLISSIQQDIINLFPAAKWIKYHTDMEDSEELVYIFHDALDSPESNTPHYVEVQGPLYDEKMYQGYTGLLFSGSAEDKVGLKAYDDIDDLLDQVDVTY